jgi:hypothetical protein
MSRIVGNAVRLPASGRRGARPSLLRQRVHHLHQK